MAILSNCESVTFSTIQLYRRIGKSGMRKMQLENIAGM